MYMYKGPLYRWVRATMTRIRKCEGLPEAFQVALDEYTRVFPEKKAWVTEVLGKRKSFLAGAGKELYLEPVVIEAGAKHLVYVQSYTTLSTAEKRVISNLFTLLAALHDVTPTRSEEDKGSAGEANAQNAQF
ncbi:MAG: hypothetical protein UMV23_05195 [Halanaerobium sp.]|nr:hypothetical protein [Halanaerobium sp.]